ncbi:chemotaxis protein CheD [Pyrococcus abyssi]|uniref:Probable chemoreceptor glutamine deamidase CheD n=1 Tax=Pyrococcus abyssi (strain GE5 / Orsay) TaxID=272844 RepID=CHED_PYRAB|nr:chemotaxis protein CheD [Pyrococcus abyssi]Q9UYF7.1 RecName: Full=Probable chemoreceptor glutamine deamidase CheD [Pyrococcus abyssi GE5]CAB50455.1 cheD chemotaxis protein cheD [Pyrococcus abyssi GE5]CCE71005.1 TPA: chemoreceptor glutamine deamidase CheD [Pyrococcus abyssi GE5]
MTREIKVGIGDYAVGKGEGIISTYGLGSCVGITLYDRVTKVGGLLHALLPEAARYGHRGNPAKYVDTGLQLLLKEVLKLGASKFRLEAKLFGGAQMFQNIKSDELKIGERNVQTAKRELKKLGIRLVAEDTGGRGGRTIYLDLSTGKVRMRKVIGGQVIEKVY